MSALPPKNRDWINATLLLVALGAFLLTCMQLGGCAHRRPAPAPEPEIVYVPTPVPCPAPPPIDRPARTLAMLPDDSAPDVVVRAAAVDLENLESTLAQCRAVLGGYGTPVS